MQTDTRYQLIYEFISCTVMADDDVECPDDGDGCTDNESTETDGQNP